MVTSYFVGYFLRFQYINISGIFVQGGAWYKMFLCLGSLLIDTSR